MLNPSLLAAFPETDNVYYEGPPADDKYQVKWPEPPNILPRDPTEPLWDSVKKDYQTAEGSEEGVNLMEGMEEDAQEVVPLGPMFDWTSGAGGIAIALKPKYELKRMIEDQVRLTSSAKFSNSISSIGKDLVAVFADSDVQVIEVEENGTRAWKIKTPDRSALLEPPFRDYEPILLQYVDGTIVPVTAIPGKRMYVVYDRTGVDYVFYKGKSFNSKMNERLRSLLQTGRMNLQSINEHGMLNGDGPIPLIIAAYMYEAQGNYSALRALAHASADAWGYVPYDICVLARLMIQRTNSGGRVTIPPIPKISLANIISDAENIETSQRVATVCGHFPMLSQGWGHLDEVSSRSASMARCRIGLRDSLFSTFNLEAGLMLARTLGLEIRARAWSKS